MQALRHLSWVLIWDIATLHGKNDRKLGNGLPSFFLKVYFLLYPEIMKFFVPFTKDCRTMNICVLEENQKRLPDTVLTFVEQENGLRPPIPLWV